MNRSFKLSLFAVVLLVGNSAFAHGVTNGKAVELSFHRLEKLISLCNLGDASKPTNIPGQPGYDATKCKNDPRKPKRGVDPHYMNKLLGTTMELIPHTTEEEPAFKTTFFQYKAADGTQRSVEVILDEEGRPVKEVENAGGEAMGFPTWSQHNPVHFTEQALHYVLVGSVTDPKIRVYNEGMTIAAIVPGKNPAGADVAVVDFETKPADPILRVRIKLDGTFDSAEYVTRSE